MPAAPVVADQIDRAVDLLQLGLEPVAVLEERRAETVGQRRAETRRREQHHVVATQYGHQRAPDRGRLGIAVHEHRRHDAKTTDFPGVDPR